MIHDHLFDQKSKEFNGSEPQARDSLQYGLGPLRLEGTIFWETSGLQTEGSADSSFAGKEIQICEILIHADQNNGTKRDFEYTILFQVNSQLMALG